MRKITVKQRGSSYQIKFMIDGVTFSKSWGNVGNDQHLAKMRYIASLVEADLALNRFYSLDDYFNKVVVWDWLKVSELISKKNGNQTNNTLMGLLLREQPRLSSPNHVRLWLDSMNISDISKRRYLSAIHAVAPKICEGISYSSKGKSGPNPFTDEEQLALLFAVDELDDYMKTLIPLWMYAGFRPGEVRALTTDDVNIKKRTITISKSMTPEGVIKDTKTGTSRVITVPMSICITTCLTTEDKVMFPQVRYHSNWVQRVWKPLLNKCGITDDQRPYRLRHTAISNAVAKHPDKTAAIATAYGTSTKMIFNYYLGDTTGVTEF